MQRGAITGAGTFVGGVFHTLPFLINTYHVAILVGIITVAIELVVLAIIRASSSAPASCARSRPSPSAA